MEITEKDVYDAKTILAYFWGASAGDWPLNKRVLEVIGEMLSKDKNCSKAMDFVPRPGFAVNANYIRRQLGGIARRLASGDHSYEACKLAIAYAYKGKVKAASMGF
jgi:hypothetical protein